MRAEQVAEIVSDITEDYNSLELTSRFDQLIAALQGQSSAPSEDNQKKVSETKSALLDALSKSRFHNYPVGLQLTLEEMKLAKYLPALAVSVSNSMEGNDLTPAAALESINKAKETLDRVMSESAGFLESAAFFEISPDWPEEDDFEFSVTIPRAAVSNELDNFGRELVKLDKMLGVFCELATGSRDDFQIKAIASTDLTVILESVPAVAVLLATTFERLTMTYERMLNIIKLHKEMRDSKVPDGMLNEMQKFIAKTLKKELDAVAKELEGKLLRKIDQGRRNELRTELRRSLDELAARFDQGYVFDVRGAEPDATSEGDGDAPENSPAWQRRVVAEKRERLKLFKVEDEPILGLTKRDEADDLPSA